MPQAALPLLRYGGGRGNRGVLPGKLHPTGSSYILTYLLFNLKKTCFHSGCTVFLRRFHSNAFVAPVTWAALGGGVLWGLICSTGDTRSLLAGGDSDTERTGTAQPPVSETRESDHLHNRMPGNSRSTTGYLSLKEIQESIEIEADEAKLIIQPLLDTEKTFIKDLDDFLTHWEALELRRKELLHRRWMQNVWNPIQKRIEQHVLCRLSEGPHKMRVMLERYLKYCNVKGFVFLDNYDPVEYNPFEQHINRQCYSQVPNPKPEDPLLPQLQSRMNEESGLLHHQTGYVYNHKEL